MTAPLHGIRRRLGALLAGADTPAPASAPPVVVAPDRRHRHTTVERTIRTDDAWATASDAWTVADVRIKALEKVRSDAAETLCALHPDGSASGNGVELTRYTAEGAVDVKAMVADGSVTQEVADAHRKASRLITRISPMRGTASGTRPGVAGGEDAETISAPTYIHEESEGL